MYGEPGDRNVCFACEWKVSRARFLWDEGGEKRVDRDKRGGVVQSSDSVSAER